MQELCILILVSRRGAFFIFIFLDFSSFFFQQIIFFVNCTHSRSEDESDGLKRASGLSSSLSQCTLEEASSSNEKSKGVNLRC